MGAYESGGKSRSNGLKNKKLAGKLTNKNRATKNGTPEERAAKKEHSDYQKHGFDIPKKGGGGKKKK